MVTVAQIEAVANKVASNVRRTHTPEYADYMIRKAIEPMLSELEIERDAFESYSDNEDQSLLELLAQFGL